MNKLELVRFRTLDYACKEALNTLCTNLTFVGNEKRVIMITSTTAHEGKSFLSINIMRTLAQLGKKVVHVDADLRKSQIAGKYGVELEELERDYCQPTDFRGEAYGKVEALLHKNFPDVAVAPFLLTAGTDARRFTDIADNILRFAPIDLNKTQFATIHNANEHIGIENIGQCVLFYKDFIKENKNEQCEK